VQRVLFNQQPLSLAHCQLCNSKKKHKNIFGKEQFDEKACLQQTISFQDSAMLTTEVLKKEMKGPH